MLSLPYSIIFVNRKDKNMNIEARKLELMHLLLKANKESLLLKLKKVFEEEAEAFYSSDISSLQQRAKASLGSLENGETRPITELKMYIKMFLKID